MPFPSPTPRPDGIRAAAIEILNPLVADGIAIGLACEVARRNVRGPSRPYLHPLFRKLAKACRHVVETVGDRVVTLGGDSVGTLEQVQGLSRVEVYPTDLRDGIAHVTALRDRLNPWIARVNEAQGKVEEMGLCADEDTLAEVLCDLEKWGRRLEAILVQS